MLASHIVHRHDSIHNKGWRFNPVAEIDGWYFAECIFKGTFSEEKVVFEFKIHSGLFLGSSFTTQFQMMAWCCTCNKAWLPEIIMTQFTDSLPGPYGLTHWGWSKMATIFLTTFWNAFSWIKIIVFWWKFPQGLIHSIPALVHIMACRLNVQATSHYLNQW